MTTPNSRWSPLEPAGRCLRACGSGSQRPRDDAGIPHGGYESCSPAHSGLQLSLSQARTSLEAAAPPGRPEAAQGPARDVAPVV